MGCFLSDDRWLGSCDDDDNDDSDASLDAAVNLDGSTGGHGGHAGVGGAGGEGGGDSGAGGGVMPACEDVSDCPEASDICHTPVCDDGACGEELIPNCCLTADCCPQPNSICEEATCEDNVCGVASIENCCVTTDDCAAPHACHEVECISNNCRETAVNGCIVCAEENDCAPYAHDCQDYVCEENNRCAFSNRVGCCVFADDCTEPASDACHNVICTSAHTCDEEAIPDCVVCSDSNPCAAPDDCHTVTCENGACGAPVAIADCCTANLPCETGTCSIPEGQTVGTCIAGDVNYVDWCDFYTVKLGSSDVTSVDAGVEFVALATVTEADMTEMGDLHLDNIKVQIGYIASDADNKGLDGAWTWVDAAHNADAIGLGAMQVEYKATLSIAVAGSYDIISRTSVDGGASWKLCNNKGHGIDYANGEDYDAANNAKLTVNAVVSNCDPACSGETPVCDELSGNCICNSTSCGDGKVCNAEGTCVEGTAAPGLIISEYERSVISNNKAIEIYNPGDEPVSLDGYVLSNGSNSIPLDSEAVIAPHSTYVICQSAIDDICDQTSGTLGQFGQKDSLTLAKDSEIVDRVGCGTDTKCWSSQDAERSLDLTAGDHQDSAWSVTSDPNWTTGNTHSLGCFDGNGPHCPIDCDPDAKPTLTACQEVTCNTAIGEWGAVTPKADAGCCESNDNCSGNTPLCDTVDNTCVADPCTGVTCDANVFECLDNVISEYSFTCQVKDLHEKTWECVKNEVSFAPCVGREDCQNNFVDSNVYIYVPSNCENGVVSSLWDCKDDYSTGYFSEECVNESIAPKVCGTGNNANKVMGQTQSCEYLSGKDDFGKKSGCFVDMQVLADCGSLLTCGTKDNNVAR